MSADFETLLAQARSHNHRRMHPRRIFAAKLAALLPASWRFSTCGLPGGLALPGAWKKQPVTLPHGAGDPAFLATVENGVACGSGTHLTGDGLIIPELSPGENGAVMARFLIHQRMFPEVPHRAGAVISLAQEGQDNFHRWMYEVLPRWQVVKASGLGHSGGVYAGLPHRFHRESLALLGLIPAQVIDAAMQPFLRSDTLLVPSMVRESGSWTTQWLREALLAPALKHSALHTRKRLYISRKSGSRKIINERELVELLKKYDFTEICMEDYSLSGQITLFHATQAIIAPHGSALTNLAFSEAGMFTVELIAEGLGRSQYAQIAESRGLRYHALACAARQPENLAVSDTQVDLEAVKAILTQL